MAPLGASLARRRRRRGLRVLPQLAVADRLLHVLRLRAIPGAVLELDRGIEPLAGVLLHVVSLASAHRAGRERVLDVHVFEGLLDLPAGVPADLRPLVPTAVQRDCHGGLLRLDEPTIRLCGPSFWTTTAGRNSRMYARRSRRSRCSPAGCAAPTSRSSGMPRREPCSGTRWSCALRPARARR